MYYSINSMSFLVFFIINSSLIKDMVWIYDFIHWFTDYYDVYFSL
jgi:hypothetical protein